PLEVAKPEPGVEVGQLAAQRGRRAGDQAGQAADVRSQRAQHARVLAALAGEQEADLALGPLLGRAREDAERLERGRIAALVELLHERADPAGQQAVARWLVQDRGPVAARERAGLRLGAGRGVALELLAELVARVGRPGRDAPLLVD